MAFSQNVHPVFGGGASWHPLSDVLGALGHDCPTGCSRAASELNAPVWLIRRGLPTPVSTRQLLVVLDTTRSLPAPGRSHALVRYLDRCTRSDGIRVRARRSSDVARRERSAMVLDATQAGPPWALPA